MAVTFTADGSIGFITLDNPPANSYDLAFMTEFSSAVDEALSGATRVVDRAERATRSSSPPAPTSSGSSRATSRTTWR